MMLISDWSILFLIILSTKLCNNIATAGAGLTRSNEEADSDIDGQKQYTESEDHEGNLRDVMGEVVDQKLEPLHKIIFQFQDIMTTKMETITSLEYDLNRKIKEITDTILLEQTNNIIKQIGNKINLDVVENKILELTDKMLKMNHMLVAIESDMQNNIITKLGLIAGNEKSQNIYLKEIADNILVEQTVNITKEINSKINVAFKEKELCKSSEETGLKLVAIEKKIEILADKINLLTTNTKQINEKTDNTCTEKNQAVILKSAEIINNKLDMLENITYTEERNIQNLWNISEKLVSKEKDLMESLDNIDKKITVLENIPILEQRIDTLMNISKITLTSIEKINQTAGTKNNTSVNSKVDPLCDITAQNSVEIKSGIWKERQTPEKDGLDEIMVKKTGCMYKAHKTHEIIERDAMSFDGTLFEWRGAVRARENAIIGVWLGSKGGNYFVIGDDENKSTKMKVWYEDTVVKEQSTPGVLSADRYVAFYVRIHAGILTIGRECDRTPILTREVSVERGEKVKMYFEPHSAYGAKYLYNCPSNVAGRLGADCSEARAAL